ncbi:MAG: DUF1858 domain-containing protein [Clostridia bacterium]|nr:DUF1858 domain-containing protein [Clostridia bacterium]
MITKSTTIADILRLAPDAAPIFMSYGLYCLSCPSASAESLEEACRVHNIECAPLLASLNLFLGEMHPDIII